MRRGGVDLAQHANDLLQLVHQHLLVLQPAGGIDQQHIGAAIARPAQCIEHETGRVGADRPRDHLGAGALAPDLQLVDGGGAEGVAGREHDASALATETSGELADRRGLAGAVDADDQDDVRLHRRVDLERACDGGQHALDLRLRDRAHVVFADAPSRSGPCAASR